MTGTTEKRPTQSVSEEEMSRAYDVGSERAGKRCRPICNNSSVWLGRAPVQAPT